jgi:dihydroneopterin aldolase
MRLEMHIGIFEEDRHTLHPLLINLEAEVKLPPNWQADDYAQILGYDKIVFMIRALAAQGHINLVETFAETIVQKCFEWPQVVAVKVRIEKTAMFPDCIPGVEITRIRQG